MSNNEGTKVAWRTMPTRLDHVELSKRTLRERASAFAAKHADDASEMAEIVEFPVPVLKVGANLRVVKAHLQRFLDTGEPVTLPFRASDDSRSFAS